MAKKHMSMDKQQAKTLDGCLRVHGCDNMVWQKGRERYEQSRRNNKAPKSLAGNARFAAMPGRHPSVGVGAEMRDEFFKRALATGRALGFDSAIRAHFEEGVPIADLVA